MRYLLLIGLFLILPALADSSSPILWGDWEGVFRRAKPQDKLVVLDLEAVWCHWCHVMDKTTYRDPAIVEFFAQNVEAVKVDQDARPDLSNRYKDYGWPATIIFDSQGRELARLSGYRKADDLLALIKKLKAKPQPIPDAQSELADSAAGQLGEELLARLRRKHVRFYDKERGAWGTIHKFVNAPVVEYCLAQSLAGDEPNSKRAVQTLDANLQLIDPIWGGVYQYSDSGVWNSPHYEKIMATQAGNLRVYSLAYSQFREPRYLKAAADIVSYLREFLRSPEGGFYASQDADLVQGKKAHDYFSLTDQQRRALGIPRIDRHQYARETGQAVEALALYSSISDDLEALKMSLESAEWVLRNRRVNDSGFRHGEEGDADFLGDTLYCGKAFLALYRATGDLKWLENAVLAARSIQSGFSKPGSDGFFTSKGLLVRDKVENVDLARFANLLYAHTGNDKHKQMAEKALRYFAIEGATDYFNPGGIILAAQEFATEPTHITVVGNREDARTQKLFSRATASPTTYLRVDLWQPGKPLPPNTEVSYPSLDQPAAYICAGGRCSMPMTSGDEIDSYWKSHHQ